MKKVFITGGAGFIGSHVVREFLKAGFKVKIYDAFRQFLTMELNEENFDLRLRLKDVWNKIEIARGDTFNKDFLRRSIESFKPDIIIHTAALPLASEAIEHTEEALDTIFIGTFNLLEVIRDIKVKRFIYISSSMVYGNFEKDKIEENAKKSPKDVYGAFKLATEIIVSTYGKRYGIDFSMIRPSAVYGPYDANKRVLYKFIKNALAGKPIEIAGDGTLSLDFTYVKDVAKGIYLISTSKNCSGKAYNLTRGEARTLNDAVEIIKKYVGKVRVKYGPLPKYVPKRGSLSVDRARRDAGYVSEYSLERGLNIYINHLRKYPY